MTLSVVAGDERADTERSTGATVDLERWRAVAESVLAAEGVQGPAELNLAFVAEARMAELNGTYMGETGATDVLSFPLDAEPEAPVVGGHLRLLGDVVICPAVAARNAAARGGDYEAEVALLVVHGVLHVLGMDHAEPHEAEAMVERERLLLAEIGIERAT